MQTSPSLAGATRHATRHAGPGRAPLPLLAGVRRPSDPLKVRKLVAYYLVAPGTPWRRGAVRNEQAQRGVRGQGGPFAGRGRPRQAEGGTVVARCPYPRPRPVCCLHRPAARPRETKTEKTNNKPTGDYTSDHANYRDPRTKAYATLPRATNPIVQVAGKKNNIRVRAHKKDEQKHDEKAINESNG